MSEEIGIIMTLQDKVSPALKTIGGNTKAFDKSMQELSQSCAAYEKRQSVLVKDATSLKQAMAATAERVKDAQKAYHGLRDETNKSALDKAISEQETLRAKLRDTESAMKDNQKAMGGLMEQARKSSNQGIGGGVGGMGGGAGGATSMLAAMGQAGMYNMAGQALSQIANTAVGSAFGSEIGGVFASAISSAASGAAIGTMIMPGIGSAVGGAIGGAVGIIQGATQVFEKRDDAFKSYVQESAEGQLAARDTDLQAGSGIMAQREQDSIAFNQLLGDGVGTQYLQDLRGMAAKTPLEYGDLTAMSKSLATGFGSDPTRMLDLMSGIGNAGSAVGIDAMNMNEMAKAMSRMQSSGKATLEYLNIFQERGIDAIGLIADSMGKTKGEVYDLISKSKLSGLDAVDAIEAGMDKLYGGAMEKQSKTFAGLTSTLADAEKEMQAAYGEGYNEVRGKGIAEQTAYLSGESGKSIQEANKAIGAWKASLENSKEEFIRASQEAVLESADYKAAMAQGTDEGYAEAGRMLMEAKVNGMNEYNASEGAQLVLSSERALITTIRNDTSNNQNYWDAGYERSQWFTKGLAAGIANANLSSLSSNNNYHNGGTPTPTKPTYTPGYMRRLDGYAYGLNRVPYDNFPALLHEGERVQTASEARQADRGGGQAVQVSVTGNTFYGSDKAFEDRVARTVAAQTVRALMLRGG